MDTAFITEKFNRIGARLEVTDHDGRDRQPAGLVSLDVQADRKGEYFKIMPRPGAPVELAVLDVQPADRHLLLLVREDGEKHKFLCGHDERHWFVAGIPEKAPVGTVRQAKEALKPADVQAAQERQKLSTRARSRRKNAAFVRQGEWFFLPASRLRVDSKLIRTNEPLVRSNGGKPHWAEFCYRLGGETVYVCSQQPNGVPVEGYRRILADNSKAKGWGWRTMLRDPTVYVRGRIRHPDHATIRLPGWHQVLMNTEGESKAMRNVAFLD
jgi:hypothetical protein